MLTKAIFNYYGEQFGIIDGNHKQLRNVTMEQFD